jgi:hypothetical protein
MHKKWEDLRAERASRPGAAERIEAARAETEAEIAAYNAEEGIVTDNKSGAFDEEAMMGIAHAKAESDEEFIGIVYAKAESDEERLAQRPDILAAIDDAHAHPENLIRNRKRPDWL